MSSKALVIFWVDCTVRMRRRTTRSWAAMGQGLCAGERPAGPASASNSSGLRR